MYPKMLSLSFEKMYELIIARGSSNFSHSQCALEVTYLFFAKSIFASLEKYHSGLGDLIYCLAKITICPLSYLPFEPYNQQLMQAFNSHQHLLFLLSILRGHTFAGAKICLVSTINHFMSKRNFQYVGRYKKIGGIHFFGKKKSFRYCLVSLSESK